MYLSRELTDSSLPKIGKEFGGRDHTTVIHATSKIARLIREDRSVYNLVQELTARDQAGALSRRSLCEAAGCPPSGPTARMAREHVCSALLPGTHTPYHYDEVSIRMIDSEIVMGTGAEDSPSPRTSSPQQARRSSPAASRRAPPCSCSAGSSCAPRPGSSHLAATDMELSLRAIARGGGRRRGRRSSCPGRLLLDIARSLPDSDVTIEHRPEEAVVVVTSGTASYRLHTYSAEDFPRLPDVETAQLHAVDRDALLETVARVGRSRVA